MILSEALAEYAAHLPALEHVRLRLGMRLQTALRDIKTHSLSSRVKTSASLGQKLARPDRTYRSLWQVTDLVGLRVTTYFEDSIPDVAQVIENSFNIDFAHTRDRLNNASFGYRSLHYVGGLDSDELPREFRFEIQVRTILQHAWAEIEHDIGYKASDTTPENIKRRFTRIAGLLELADEEFVSIRRDLRHYAEAVHEDQPFPLDRLSLQALVTTTEDLDERIAQQLGKPLGESLFFPEYLLKMLKLAGFRTTREVHGQLQSQKEAVLKMVAPYFEFSGETWRLSSGDFESVPRGYALFFLSHAAILDSTILEQNKVAKLAEFYRQLDYPDDETAAHQVAAALVQKLSEVR